MPKWMVKDHDAFGDRKHIFSDYHDAAEFVEVSQLSAYEGNPKSIPQFTIIMIVPEEKEKP